MFEITYTNINTGKTDTVIGNRFDADWFMSDFNYRDVSFKPYVPQPEPETTANKEIEAL